MKKSEKVIGTTVLAIVSGYFASSFIAWDFNPEHWGVFGRYGSLAGLFLTVWCGPVLIMMFDKDASA